MILRQLRTASELFQSRSAYEPLMAAPLPVPTLSLALAVLVVVLTISKRARIPYCLC